MKKLFITFLFLFGILALPAAQNAHATDDGSQSAGNDASNGDDGTAVDPTTGTTGQDDDDDTPDMIHPNDHDTEEAKASISTALLANIGAQSLDGTNTGGTEQGGGLSGTAQPSGSGTTGDGGTPTPKT